MAEEPESLDAAASRELAAIRDAGLYRRLRRNEDSGLLNFSSNDYLGLSHHPELKSAMTEAIARHGVGSGASRLVCGNYAAHEALEEVLASFKGTEAALAFSSGYATALGVIPAVVGSGDTIILDKLCHASLIDAARLSGATIRVFPHNHLEKLERILSSRGKGRVLVVTESIFSMDGDAAPLAEIVKLKDEHGAWLMVDEAHAVGVLGPQGRGLAAKLGVEDRVELQMGTLSKALGVHGGYVAGSRAIIDLLINRARSLIYSTAPPPAVAATAEAAVRLVQGAEGDVLRKSLQGNLALLRRLLPGVPEVAAAIVPLIVGDEEKAMETARLMMEAGFLIPAIRYPTVARGAARLRLTLGAAHEPAQIESLVASLLDRMPQLGLPA